MKVYVLDNAAAEAVNVQWPGITSQSSICVDILAEKTEEILFAVTTMKKTSSHKAVINARDDAYNVSYCFDKHLF